PATSRRAQTPHTPRSSASRRPYRSPRLPAVRSKPAKTRLYASTIHCSELDVALNERANVGRATFRLAFAITIITSLTHNTPSVHHRRSYSRADVAARESTERS